MCTKTTKDWVRLIRVYTGRFECDHSNRIRPLSQQPVVSATHLLAHTLFTTDTTARWPQTLHCFCCYVHHTASISELVWALPLSVPRVITTHNTAYSAISPSVPLFVGRWWSRCAVCWVFSSTHTPLHTHTSPPGKNACGAMDAQHRPSLGVIRA